MKGVAEVSVNNAYDTIRVVYDPALVSFSRLETAIAGLGAQIAVSLDQATFALEGLESPESALSLERSLSSLPGVLWIGVNFAAAQAHIEFDRRRLSLNDLARRITTQGIHPRCLQTSAAVPPDDAYLYRGEEQEEDSLFSPGALKPHLLLGVGMLLGMLGLIASLLPLSGAGVQLPRILYGLAVLTGGWKILRAALLALRIRSLEWSILAMLAVIGLLVLDQWGEAAGFVLVIGLGNALLSLALERSRRLLRVRVGVKPTTARVLRNGQEQLVPVEHVAEGERMVVRPGELIPLDGELTGGNGAVEETTLFGERGATTKAPGARLFAGTRNEQGTLEAVVTRSHRDCALTLLRQSLAEALARPTPFERRLLRAAHLLMAVTLWLAVALSFLPPLLARDEFARQFPHWFHRGLSLLALGCPSALLLSVPVALCAALRMASQQGVLLKGGAFLEAMGLLKAVVYDKTGTLTHGQPTVSDVIPLSDMTGAEILGVAAAMEQPSSHPLARAIKEEARRHPLAATPEVTYYQELPALGIFALVAGKPTILGNVQLFKNQNLSLTRTAQEVLAEAETSGRTALLLGDGSGLHGILLFNDPPRMDFKSVIAELPSMDVRYQGALSGDMPRIVAQVSSTLGLDHADGGLSPDQKAQRVHTLQGRYGAVAMIGNGFNDLPAMAVADVGIALGTASREGVLDSADVTLLRADLAALPFLIRLSRRVQAILRQNVGFTLAGSVLLIIVALAVRMPLWIAALGEAGLMLAVTFNALRLIEIPAAAAPISAPAAAEETEEALLELVFVNDSSVDEQPQPDTVYPQWDRFIVSFSGKPIRFGRKVAASVLPVQVEDEAMSRLHGEIRLEGRRPVIVDLGSTNGIRRNGQSQSALIPSERPVPLRYGDVLRIGRNTRIEVHPPGGTPKAVVANRTSQPGLGNTSLREIPEHGMNGYNGAASHPHSQTAGASSSESDKSAATKS